MARILVLYESSGGHTRLVANDLARVLRRHGHVADVRTISSLLNTFSLRVFDGAVLGGATSLGRYPRALVTFVRENADMLSRMQAWFFSESLVAASGQQGQRLAHRYVDRLVKETGFQPHRTLVLAGPLSYRHYSPSKRLAMRAFAKLLGLSTDARRNHDHTDWARVRTFAEELALRYPAEEHIPGPGHALEELGAT